MRRVFRNMTRTRAIQLLKDAHVQTESARVAAAIALTSDIRPIPARLCSRRVREAAEAAVVALRELSTVLAQEVSILSREV